MGLALLLGMEGLRILLLTSSIGATMAGTLYAGVQAERARVARTFAPGAMTPVSLNPAPETSEPPQAGDDAEAELALLESGEDIILPSGVHIGAVQAVVDPHDDIVLEGGARIGPLAPESDAEDIVLESGVRIGAVVLGEELETNELTESQASDDEATSDATPRASAMRPRARRTRRAPPRPPAPRLHPNPGVHTILTARRMMARNEVIQGSCYRYLSEVFARAGHRGWRKRRIVYRAEREGPYANLDLVRPGDWLYIVNDPSRTPVGTHSVMFVGWTDRAQGYANVISHPGWGAPSAGRERTYDISRTYRIIRPTLSQ